MVKRKRLDFEGSSYEALVAFPDAARQLAGYELDILQHGRQPDDWKPMSSIGPGVS